MSPRSRNNRADRIVIVDPRYQLVSHIDITPCELDAMEWSTGLAARLLISLGRCDSAAIQFTDAGGKTEAVTFGIFDKRQVRIEISSLGGIVSVAKGNAAALSNAGSLGSATQAALGLGVLRSGEESNQELLGSRTISLDSRYLPTIIGRSAPSGPSLVDKVSNFARSADQ